MEDDGTALFVLVGHEAGVLEVGDEGRFALDARVGDLTFFLRVEFLPLLVVELLVKRYQRSVKMSLVCFEGGGQSGIKYTRKDEC